MKKIINITIATLILTSCMSPSKPPVVLSPCVSHDNHDSTIINPCVKRNVNKIVSTI